MQNSRLVYSTDTGKITNQEPQIEPKGDGTIIIRFEKKGRKGQGVTVLSGFIINQNQLKTLARTLKQKCSSGGTIKDGIIEIQGHHSNTLNDKLLALGFKTKSD